jgi:hypothetical protein
MAATGAGSVMAIHSCSLGAPILFEEAKAAVYTNATNARGYACLRRAAGDWTVEYGMGAI